MPLPMCMPGKRRKQRARLPTFDGAADKEGAADDIESDTTVSQPSSLQPAGKKPREMSSDSDDDVIAVDMPNEAITASNALVDAVAEGALFRRHMETVCASSQAMSGLDAVPGQGQRSCVGENSVAGTTTAASGGRMNSAAESATAASGAEKSVAGTTTAASGVASLTDLAALFDAMAPLLTDLQPEELLRSIQLHRPTLMTKTAAASPARAGAACRKTGGTPAAPPEECSGAARTSAAAMSTGAVPKRQLLDLHRPAGNDSSRTLADNSDVDVVNDDEEDEDEAETNQVLEQMDKVVNRIRMHAFDVPVEIGKQLTVATGEIQSLFRSLVRKLDQRSRVKADPPRTKLNANPTFRQNFPALGAPSKSKKKQQKVQKQQQEFLQLPKLPPAPKTWAVIVTGDGPDPSTADAVKEKVLRDIPSMLPGVSVSGVRRNKGVGVILETKSVEDHEKLLASDAFKASGLVVAVAPKPGRRVLIGAVPVSVSDEKLMDELVQRNSNAAVSMTEWRSEIHLRSRGRETDGKSSVIMEVSARVLAFWKVLGRVDINWQSYYVRELSMIDQCYKCCAYGHIAARCKVKEELCRRCCQPGHRVKDCTNAESCRNCMHVKGPADHAANSSSCPFYKLAIERSRQHRQVDQE